MGEDFQVPKVARVSEGGRQQRGEAQGQEGSAKALVARGRLRFEGGTSFHPVLEIPYSLHCTWFHRCRDPLSKTRTTYFHAAFFENPLEVYGNSLGFPLLCHAPMSHPPDGWGDPGRGGIALTQRAESIGEGIGLGRAGFTLVWERDRPVTLPYHASRPRSAGRPTGGRQGAGGREGRYVLLATYGCPTPLKASHLFSERHEKEGWF